MQRMGSAESTVCGVTECIDTFSNFPLSERFFLHIVVVLLLLIHQLETYTKKDDFSFQCLNVTNCSIECRRKENNTSIVPSTAGKSYKLHLQTKKLTYHREETVDGQKNALLLSWRHRPPRPRLQSLPTSTSRHYISHSSSPSSSFTFDQQRDVTQRRADRSADPDRPPSCTPVDILLPRQNTIGHKGFGTIEWRSYCSSNPTGAGEV